MMQGDVSGVEIRKAVRGEHESWCFVNKRGELDLKPCWQSGARGKNEGWAESGALQKAHPLG